MADDYYESKTTEIGPIFEGIANLAYFAMLLVLFWQGLVYLKDGAWPPMPILQELYSMGWEWAGNPKSWFGLHKMISGLSIAGALFMAGLIFQFLSVLNPPPRGRWP